MIKFPFICACGYNTMDAAKSAEHARQHEKEEKHGLVEANRKL